MIRLPAALAKRPFLTQMATLMTGTAAAQGITIVATPIIARLFTAEDYGLQGLYMSMATTIQVMACLRYEFAQVLPKDERDARALALLGLLSATGIAGLCLLAVALAGGPIARLLNAPGLGPWLWWVPATVLMMGSFNVFSYWMTRHKRFREQATNQVGAAAATSLAKLGAGWARWGAPGLLFGVLVGQLVPAVGLAWRVLRKETLADWREARTRLRRVAVEYKHFPIYIGPQALLNSLTQAMPAFILAAYTSVAAVGHFAMARTLLLMPANFLIQAFRKVYYPTCSEAYNRTGNVLPILRRSTLLFAGIGLLPFLLVFFFSPWIFRLALGPEWTEAGSYARWVGLWVYMILIMPPATVTAQVLRMQRFLFGVELVLSVRVLVLWWAVERYDALTAVMAFSLTTALVCLGTILLVVRAAASAAKEGPNRRRPADGMDQSEQTLDPDANA